MQAAGHWRNHNFLNVGAPNTVEILKQSVRLLNQHWITIKRKMIRRIIATQELWKSAGARTPIKVVHVNATIQAHVSEMCTASQKLLDGRLADGTIG